MVPLYGACTLQCKVVFNIITGVFQITPGSAGDLTPEGCSFSRSFHLEPLVSGTSTENKGKEVTSEVRCTDGQSSSTSQMAVIKRTPPLWTGQSRL